MAKYCPILECRVVYLTCIECEEQLCRKNKQQINNLNENNKDSKKTEQK